MLEVLLMFLCSGNFSPMGLISIILLKVPQAEPGPALWKITQAVKLSHCKPPTLLHHLTSQFNMSLQPPLIGTCLCIQTAKKNTFIFIAAVFWVNEIFITESHFVNPNWHATLWASGLPGYLVCVMYRTSVRIHLCHSTPHVSPASGQYPQQCISPSKSNCLY